MRSEASTQFGITVSSKDRLDRFKADFKDDIIKKYRLRRRLVTNSHAIIYLLDLADEHRRSVKASRKVSA
jgi:hypothetical protein